MAAPASAPSNFWAQTGNQQNYVSWDLFSGATSYNVNRSTDGVTYSSIATPSTPYYLDTSVTVGTIYYYKVAAVNVDGTGPYTTAQSVIPTPTGEMCLGQIRLAAQQRADRVNSQFVTLPEWNSYVNQSLFELYDLLIKTSEDYFIATPVSLTTDGTNYAYALPNGTNYSSAAPFYKLKGVDLAVNVGSNAYVTVNKFNFNARNEYIYPDSQSTMYGVFNLRYRLMGSNIEFVPTPAAGQTIRLWYVPRLTMLLRDFDITTSGVSGWLEYVIVDAAIKALQKEEADVTALMLQKAALIKRIEESAVDRDEGQPDTISDVRSWNDGRGWPGPSGGF